MKYLIFKFKNIFIERLIGISLILSSLLLLLLFPTVNILSSIFMGITISQLMKIANKKIKNARNIYLHRMLPVSKLNIIISEFFLNYIYLIIGIGSVYICIIQDKGITFMPRDSIIILEISMLVNSIVEIIEKIIRLCSKLNYTKGQQSIIFLILAILLAITNYLIYINGFILNLLIEGIIILLISILLEYKYIEQ